MCATVLGVLLAGPLAEAGGWPPFLPAASRFGEPVVASVERVWEDPTLTRTVEADVAPVPAPIYLAFVDAPDVTSAAARHLGIARYEVQMIAADWYRADDRDGNRGLYRVLVRDGGRRVVLSWGSHSGRLTGTIRGRALTVLDFTPRGRETAQRLTAYVLIENAAAAALARMLAPLFGHVMDRKLTEGFGVTARVAEWALAQPGAFCDWLAHEPSLTDRPADLPAGLPACAAAPAGQSALSRRP